MTDNISRMYELAGVKKVGKKHSCNISDFYNCSTRNCDICDKAQYKNYSPFTAEKQLNILKIIVHSFGFNSLDKPIWDKGWNIAIAKLVNIYWEVLTEEEKQQVRGILQ